VVKNLTAGVYMEKYYEKSTKELMIDFCNNLKTDKGGIFTKAEIVDWFKNNYPKIKIGTIQCHLIKLSVNAPSRVHYKAHEDGRDDILFKINSNTYKTYAKDTDIINANTYEYSDDNEYVGSSEFAYEKDLQNYLAKNLEIIEAGLKLFEEDGINGIEYPVDGRYIDILAVDKNNDYVVIELKVSRGYDRVIGQLLRYKSWIKKYQAEENQKVRGIIICKEITDDLILACSEISNIALFEYELSIKIKKV
jgi:hypothetical protein